jgi:O-antigen/teichoic acid export membrane protein
VFHASGSNPRRPGRCGFVWRSHHEGNALKILSPLLRLARPGSITRRAGIVLAGSGASKAISFITMWLMVQCFAPDDFGRFSAIDTVNGFCSGAIATGLNWWLIRSVARGGNSGAARRAARKVLAIEATYGLVAGTALLLGAPLVASWFFSKPELAPFIRLSAIGVISYILVAYRSSLYQASRMFARDAVFNVVNSGLFLAAAVLAILILNRGLLTVGALYVAIPVLVSGAALLLPRFSASGAQEEEKEQIAAPADKGYSWLVFYSLSLWLMSQVHMLVMTRTRSLEELGAYSLALKVYLVSLMLTNAINVVLLPEFSACRTRAELRSRYRKTFGLTALGALAVAAAIPFVGIILGAIAGDRYAAAAPVLRILLVGTALSTLLSPPANVLFAEARFRTLALIGASMAVLNVAGQAILIPRFGAVAAAGVQVGSFLLMNGAFTILAARLLSRPD